MLASMPFPERRSLIHNAPVNSQSKQHTAHKLHHRLHRNTMGFDTKFIENDAAHYRHYSCGVCQQLVDLDCLVTTACSHVACRRCMAKHLSSSSGKTCPTCHKNFDENEDKNQHPSSILGKNFAQPLQICQPLAYRILKDIEVSCPLPSLQCGWHGRYQELREHLLCQTAHVIQPNPKHLEQRQAQQQPEEAARSNTPLRSNRRLDVRVERSRKAEKQAREDDVTETTVSCSGSETSSTWDEDELLIEEVKPPHLPMPSNKCQPQPPTKNLCKVCESFKEEGNAHFTQQRYAQANALYTRGLNFLKARSHKMDNEDMKQLEATLLSNRSACHLAEHNFEEAIKDAQTALAKSPTYEKARLRLARAHMQQGNFQAAARACQESQTKEPSAALQELKKQTMTLHQSHMDALTMLADGRYEMAKAKVAMLVPETNAPSILLLAVEAALGVGDTNQAVLMCSRVLRLDPQSTKAQLLRGQTAILEGKIEPGIRFLKQATRMDPDSVSTAQKAKQWLAVANGMQRVQDAVSKANWEAVLNRSSELIRDCPVLPRQSALFATLYAARARSYEALGKHEAALEACAVVLAKHPRHPDAWVAKLLALTELRRYEQAMEDVKRIQASWGKHDGRFDKQFKKIQEAMQSQTRPDFYAILAVSRTATAAELSKAYRIKTRKCHPDRFVHASAAEKEAAVEQFQRLNEAMEFLSDAFMRKEYDAGHDLVSIRRRAFLWAQRAKSTTSMCNDQ